MNEADGGSRAGWVAHLRDQVRELADGESLTVRAPASGVRPVRLRRARLGGLIPARHESVAAWVRLVRSEDHLKGFCVGAEALGGSFPLSPEEDAALMALGWRRPDRREGTDYVRFWPDDVAQGPFLPREEAERAARMVLASFTDVLAPGEDPPTVTR